MTIDEKWGAISDKYGNIGTRLLSEGRFECNVLKGGGTWAAKFVVVGETYDDCIEGMYTMLMAPVIPVSKPTPWSIRDIRS